jgi:hypothetical protein
MYSIPYAPSLKCFKQEYDISFVRLTGMSSLNDENEDIFE